MLGAHETNADLTDLIEGVDSRWKIFTNKRSSFRLRNDIIRQTSFPHQRYREISKPVRSKPVLIDHQQEFFAELLLEKYAADCILLSENNEVLYAAGKADDYLHYPKRKSNLNLFDMVSGNTSLALRNGLREIMEVERNVVLQSVNATTKDDESRIVDFFFYSIFSSKTSTKYILVEIKPADKNEDDQEFTEISSRESLKEIELLEVELRQARKELRYNSDELETINEELQSSNEEMKSSNEEMQTTNEELQSANEELKTVNYELKTKIEELTTLHDDVNNLFISTQIATLFLDRSLKIRRFTPALQSYFNVRESDIGRPIYHYTYNFDYPDLEADVEKVLQTLQPLQKEISTRNNHVLVKIIPFKADKKRIEGVILTFVDVIEIQEANLKLKEMAETLQKGKADLEQSEKYWKSLVDNTPDIVARLDKNATILFINNSVGTHTGIEPHRLIGKKLLQLKQFLKGEEINQINRQVVQAMNNKQIINFYQNITLENGQKYFYITIIPEQNLMEDKFENILLIGRDITHLRSVENQFQEKNRRLKDMNQYMDNFVHAVAHDLRSPLTNLKLILELIADEDNPEKRELLVGKLDSAVTRIDDILNGLIEIIDTQVNFKEKERKIKFSAVVHKALDQLKEELPVDAQINVNFEEEEILHVRGFIYSIIRNLLSNSIKYRRKDMPLKINIKTKKSGMYTLLSIEDNGIGMDFDGVKNDLFKPFKRFTSEGGGLGTGLYIVKSMIEKTGGKIEVDSEEGKGTTFLIYLKEQISEYSSDR